MKRPKGGAPLSSRAFRALPFLCGLLGSAAPGHSSADEPPVRDLRSLSRAARARYPALRAAREGVEAARARLSEATISPFFQLQATAALSLAPEARGTPVYSPDPELPLSNPLRPIVGVGVEGAVPLYTFGKLGAARDAARAGVRAARHQRKIALADLLFDVRRAYYALQFALDVKQMIREGRRPLRRATKYIEEQLAADNPDVSEPDRWRLETALAEVEARQSEAVRLEAGARAALRTLTGISEFRIPDCPSQPLESRLDSVDHYTVSAETGSPRVGMLQAGLAARQAGVDAAEAGYFPDLALALRAQRSYAPGSTDQSNPFVNDPANRTALTAGLVARWSLDLLGNAQRVRRSEAELRGTEAQIEQARDGIELEVTSEYQKVEDARRRVAAWARGHQQARAWFVASVGAYDVGTLEAQDLVDSLRSYFTNRFNHLNAIRDYNQARASLARAAGTGQQPSDGEWEPPCGE